MRAFLLTSPSDLSCACFNLTHQVYKVPIFGWLGYLYGAIIGINRSNREEAIRTLTYAREYMSQWFARFTFMQCPLGF